MDFANEGDLAVSTILFRAKSRNTLEPKSELKKTLSGKPPTNS